MKTKILSLDYGRKNIGISISDTTQSIAFLREAIENNPKGIKKLEELITTENIQTVIVGKTLNPNPHFQPNEEAKKILHKINPNIKIIELEEDFSTFEAIERLKQNNYSAQEVLNMKDSVAAQLLLEKYIDNK